MGQETSLTFSYNAVKAKNMHNHDDNNNDKNNKNNNFLLITLMC